MADFEEHKNKFLDDNREEIERYNEYKAKQEGGGEEYGDEDEDEGEAKEEAAPTLPVFNEAEFLESWDAENPDIIIQDSTEDDIDNDWVLTEEEVEEQRAAYWSKFSE